MEWKKGTGSQRQAGDRKLEEAQGARQASRA